MGGASIPFIVSTGPTRESDDVRRQIRSHVMMGRNRGKARRVKMTQQQTHCSDVAVATGADDDIETSRECSPLSSDSNLPILGFTDPLGASVFTDILAIYSKTHANPLPVETPVFANKYDVALIAPLSHDAAYMHAMALLVNSQIDLLSGRDNAVKHQFEAQHLSKSIKLLNHRLSYGDETEVISDATLAVVMALGLYARTSKDHRSSRSHLEGLAKLIQMRGGMSSIDLDTKLAFKVFWSDIGLAVECGTRPVFFFEPNSLESFTPVLRNNPSGFQGADRFRIRSALWSRAPKGINDEIRTIWAVMQEFSIWINDKVESDSKISEKVFISMMITIMYRLLHMSFAPDSLNETTRLSLLACSAHVFLQWHTCKARTAHLCASYRGSLLALEAQRRQHPHFTLWLLIVGSATVFTNSDKSWLDPWLRSTLKLCKVTNWTELKQILHSYIWIGVIFDEPARAMYEALYRE